MAKVSADIQFYITPCPVCGQEFTPKDVELGKHGIMALRHDCKEGDCPSYIVTGGNLRMVVQNWNRLLWRYRQ